MNVSCEDEYEAMRLRSSQPQQCIPHSLISRTWIFTLEGSVKSNNLRSSMNLAKLAQSEQETHHGLAGSAVHSVFPIRFGKECLLSRTKVPVVKNSIQCHLFAGRTFQRHRHLSFMSQGIANEITECIRSFI